MHTVRRRAFTLVELLVVIAIIGILTGMLLPAVQATREAARRINCTQQMRNITIACFNRQSATQKFPIGVSPVTLDGGSTSSIGKSWLVSIFPEIEQGNLAERLNTQSMGIQTDAQLNTVYQNIATENPVATLLCPSATGDSERSTVNDRTGITSHYIGNAGPATNTPANIYRVYNPGAGDGPIGLEGVFSPFTLNAANSLPIYSNKRAVKISDIRDGLSNTILIGESSRTPPGSGTFIPHRVPWTFGGTGEFDSAAKGFVPREIFAVRSVGQNRINEPGDFLTNTESRNSHCFNSNHPGGAVFSTADGATQFVSDSIEANTLIELSSIAGNEIADFE